MKLGLSRKVPGFVLYIMNFKLCFSSSGPDHRQVMPGVGRVKEDYPSDGPDGFS